MGVGWLGRVCMWFEKMWWMAGWLPILAQVNQPFLVHFLLALPPLPDPLCGVMGGGVLGFQPFLQILSVWFGLCLSILLWHLTFKSVRDICDTRPLAHRLLFHNNAHVSTYSCTSQTIACLPSTRVRKEKLWVLHILPPFLYIYNNAFLLQLRKNDCWTIWESTCWLPV